MSFAVFFANFLSIQTYDINYQVPDSAATASSMYSGVKTIGYSMGFDSSIDHFDPSSALDAQEVTTIFTWAQDAGKSTGMVWHFL